MECWGECKLRGRFNRELNEFCELGKVVPITSSHFTEALGAGLAIVHCCVCWFLFGCLLLDRQRLEDRVLGGGKSNETEDGRLLGDAYHISFKAALAS